MADRNGACSSVQPALLVSRHLDTPSAAKHNLQLQGRSRINEKPVEKLSFLRAGNRQMSLRRTHLGGNPYRHHIPRTAPPQAQARKRYPKYNPQQVKRLRTGQNMSLPARMRSMCIRAAWRGGRCRQCESDRFLLSIGAMGSIDLLHG